MKARDPVALYTIDRGYAPFFLSVMLDELSSELLGGHTDHGGGAFKRRPDGTWVATAGMITPRLAHTATLLPGGRVLVSGGGEPGGPEFALDKAELYDPVTETWAAIGDMIQAHFGHTATLLPNGRVLVVGGAGSELEASAELYDPGGQTR